MTSWLSLLQERAVIDLDRLEPIESDKNIIKIPSIFSIYGVQICSRGWWRAGRV